MKQRKLRWAILNNEITIIEYNYDYTPEKEQEYLPDENFLSIGTDETLSKEDFSNFKLGPFIEIPDINLFH